MKTNSIRTNFVTFLKVAWAAIMDAFQPDWRRMLPPDENNPQEDSASKADDTPEEPPYHNDCHNEDQGVMHQNTNMSQENTSTNNPEDTQNKRQETTPLSSQGNEQEAILKEMEKNAELVQLRQRVQELEKERASDQRIQGLLEKLRRSSPMKETGRIGRPPKPHIRVSLNLQTRWSLLFNFGRETDTIKSNITDFVNAAIEKMFQEQYPALFSVYLQSIQDNNNFNAENNNKYDILETPRDGP